MKTVIVERMDGGVSFVFPGRNATPEMLERDALNVEGYISHREIGDDIIPSDRTFRDAWRLNGNSIIHDMDKARTIQLERIRAARNEKLRKLDIESLKGRNVESEKQNLRNLPNSLNLSAARTVEELKNLFPKEIQ